MGKRYYNDKIEYSGEAKNYSSNESPYSDNEGDHYHRNHSLKQKKSKKSHRYEIVMAEEIGNSESERRRRKHKHKHKRQKQEARISPRISENEDEGYERRRKLKNIHSNENSESYSEQHHRRSSHRKRSKHRNSEDWMNKEIKKEPIDADLEEGSVVLHGGKIKLETEPISDLDEEYQQEDQSAKRSSKSSNYVNEKQPVVENVWIKTEPETEEGTSDGTSKSKIDFGLSGKLTEDANMYNGIVIKYSQPPEARKPKRRWRWYIFKGDQEIPFLPLHRQSAYLIGRERKVADIPTDHPSCSKQHAVLQYRLVSYDREDGSVGRTVKPYILDLGSANGTYVNNRRIEAKRYVELLEKDVVKFGYSTREYVLLHEASKGSDDELVESGPEVSPISMLRDL